MECEIWRCRGDAYAEGGGWGLANCTLRKVTEVQNKCFFSRLDKEGRSTFLRNVGKFTTD